MVQRVSPDSLPYTVDSVDIVEEVADLRVLVIALSGEQEVPWHLHTHVTDSFFCLSGVVVVEHGRDRHRVALESGDSFQVPVRTPHRVSCRDGGSCRFLLIQGVGEYDFVPTEPPRGSRDS